MYVISAIKRRKTVYFGHMIRRDNIQRVLVDGQVQGKRGRGRPRTGWATNVYEWTESTSYTRRWSERIKMEKLGEAWQSTFCMMIRGLSTENELEHENQEIYLTSLMRVQTEVEKVSEPGSAVPRNFFGFDFSQNIFKKIYCR